VFNNDPQKPRLVITMQGTVRSLIDVRPSSGITFRGTIEQVGESTVDMVSTSQAFKIQKVESNLEDKIAYSLETVQDGRHYRLKISNRVRQGSYSGFVKCLTDVPQKPEIVVRVSGFIEGDIAVKPQTVLVGKLAPQQPERQGKVMVVSNRGKPFKITRLTYDEHLVDIVQQPLPKEPGYSLDVIPKIENIPAGARQQMTLVIETDTNPQDAQEVQIHIFNSVEKTKTQQETRGK